MKGCIKTNKILKVIERKTPHYFEVFFFVFPDSIGFKKRLHHCGALK